MLQTVHLSWNCTPSVTFFLVNRRQCMSLRKVSNISTNLNPCDIVDVPTPWRLKSYAEPLQKWFGLASQCNRLIDDKTFFHVLPSGQKHSDLNNIHRFSTFTALRLWVRQNMSEQFYQFAVSVIGMSFFQATGHQSGISVKASAMVGQSRGTQMAKRR